MLTDFYSLQLQLSNVWDGSGLVCIALSPARKIWDVLLTDVVSHRAVICDYLPDFTTVHATMLYINIRHCNSALTIMFSFQVRILWLYDYEYWSTLRMEDVNARNKAGRCCTGSNLIFCVTTNGGSGVRRENFLQHSEETARPWKMS